MALDLQQMFDQLKQARDASSEGSPLKDVFNKAVSSFDSVNKSMRDMSASIRDIRAINMAARRVGKAGDVQAQIRALLQTKIEEDKIERNRHERMMQMAEELIPQVTEEQLAAIKAQQSAWREHQKNLQEELSMEKDIADIRKSAAAEVAEKEIAVAKENLKAAQFAQKDKYGTIGSAIGGLADKAQDPLSKFLVAGLGRFVSEKREAPLAEATQGEFDKFKKERDAKLVKDIAAIEKLSAEHQEDIKEAFAVAAAKGQIVDPGSAAKLYNQRISDVTKLAGLAEGTEKDVVAGTYGKQVGATKEAKLLAGASPAALQAISGVYTPVAPPTKATFAKAGGQEPPSPTGARGTAPTSPVTPATGAAKAAAGAFGGKGGYLNIGGITNSIASLSRGFQTFLGPWGLVASAAQSFDRTMPIISDGAGALMDVTKLLMPMTISAIAEGFNSLLGGVNGIVSAIDESRFGSGKRSAWSSQIAEARIAESLRRMELDKARQSVGGKTTRVRNTTSLRAGALIRQDTPLTSPSEATRISKEAMSGYAPSGGTVGYSEYLKEQLRLNESMRQAVKDAASNPGTTLYQSRNPSMDAWPA